MFKTLVALFEGIPHFGTPKLCQILSFRLKRLKSLNFGGWREPPFWNPYFFIMFNLFLKYLPIPKIRSI